MSKLLMGILCVLCLSGCGRDDHNHPSNLSGQTLFELHCASCHGPTGEGSFLLGVPANNEGHLLNVHIRKKIQQGMTRDDQMPVFEAMSDAEANKIIGYINSLSRKQH
jgi:mono/diheme cytochrome c family protein